MLVGTPPRTLISKYAHEYNLIQIAPVVYAPKASMEGSPTSSMVKTLNSMGKDKSKLAATSRGFTSGWAGVLVPTL